MPTPDRITITDTKAKVVIDLFEIIEAAKLGRRAVDAEDTARSASDTEAYNARVRAVVSAVKSTVSRLYEERWGLNPPQIPPDADAMMVYRKAETLGLKLPRVRPMKISATECAKVAESYMATSCDLNRVMEPYREQALNVLGGVLKRYSLRPVDAIQALVDQALENTNIMSNLSFSANGVTLNAEWVSPGRYAISASAE